MRGKFVIRTIAIGVMSVWGLAGAANTQMRHHHLLMVVAKKLPGIALYDADTDELICRAGGMGVSPHEAEFSPDGKFAYVPVYGSAGVGQPGTDEHALHFIRTSDCQNVYTMDTGEDKRPHGIVVGKSGRIYLTTEISKSLLIIDPDQHKVIGRIPTGSATSHTIAITADEKRIYTSNVQSKTVSVLDVPERKLLATIDTGSENQRMSVSPDQKHFVTSLGPKHEVAFYRTADNQLDFTIAVNGTPFANKFSRDGRYLYEVGTIDGKVAAWKIDLSSRKVVATVENLGTAIGTVSVNPFSGRVYVSDSGGDKISQIDPETWKVAKVLPTDKVPDQMLFVVSR